MEGEKVVALFEGDYGIPGIQEGVIELLEDVLAEVRRGEVIAVAMAVVRPNGVIGTLSRKGSARHADLVAGAAALQHDLCTNWNED